jgi:hypothetical protein
MAAFVAKQMVGNKLNAVKGKYSYCNVGRGGGEFAVKMTNAHLTRRFLLNQTGELPIRMRNNREESSQEMKANP